MIFIFLTIIGLCECSALPLFPTAAKYVYAYSGVSSTKFVAPPSAGASHGLEGLLTVYTSPSLATPQGEDLLVHLTDLKHSVYNGAGRTDEDMQYQELHKDTVPLTEVFIVHVVNGAVHGISVGTEEPLWSINMKRALAAALQLQIQGRDLPGAFKVTEPCLHGMCATEYSSADGKSIRKSHGVPTLLPSASHRLWVSIMPNVCAKDVKNPLIGNVERWYTLDDNGLSRISSIGSIEIHYHRHIFQSMTNITLDRIRFEKGVVPPKVDSGKITRVGLTFQPPPPEDETAGRIHLNNNEKQKALLKVLQQTAGGLEVHGPRDSLIKEKLPLRIHSIMASMTLEELKAVFEELKLGTSYSRETMRNIFVEAVPQCGTKAGALLSRDLVVERRVDTMGSLRLLQALPFGVQQLDERLLAELQTFLQLGQEHHNVVRHSAILAFASLVNRAFLSGGCTHDTFEEYVQKYFSRFTESPDYADRLVWLMGLSNLQVERVTTYLTPVVSGALGHSSHERFLAVWATMPLAHLHAHETHNVYWPILQNELEPLELRVAALSMLLLAEPSPHRLMSLFWYINSQSCGHLKNFFYTTIKSMEHTTFDCYVHLAKLSSYLSKMVKSPESRFWATGNYLLDGVDMRRDMGGMMQLFTVADPRTGLPNIFYLTTNAHNAGLVVADYAIYMKLQGMCSVVMRRLMRMGSSGLSLEHLEQALKDHKQQKTGAQLHLEFIIKHQGKAVLALHINQTFVDKWSQGDLVKTVNSFIQSESHINNQFLVYPTVLTSVLSSEMGTPVQTDTMLASMTSLRGNLTHSMSADDISRKNDVHFRTSTLALLSLSTYNPVADTTQVAEVAQVTDLYLPVNFSFGVSLKDKTFKTSWLLPGGSQVPGLSAYSAATVSLYPTKNNSLPFHCKNCQREIAVEAYTDVFNMSKGRSSLTCEGVSTLPEILWQIMHSHQSNTQILPAAKLAVIGVHVIALGTVPAEGACHLILSPSADSMEPLWMDTEMAILPSTANKVQVKADITRRNGTTGDRISKLSTSLMFDHSVKIARAAAKVTWSHLNNNQSWKMCVDAKRYFDDYDNKHSTEVIASWGEDSLTCPTSGQFYFTMNVIPEDKEFNISLSTTNVSENVRKLSERLKSLLDILPHEYEGISVANSLLTQLSKKEANLTAFLKHKERFLEVILWESPYTETLQVPMPQENLIPLMNSNPYQLFAISSGFARQCSLTNDKLTDVENVATTITFQKETLLLGDCSSNHNYAITKLPGSFININLYFGEHLINAKSTNGSFSVTFNGENVSWESFQYPDGDSFFDIRMMGTKNSLTINAKTGWIQLNMKNNEAVITFPANLLEVACGACVNHHDEYFHC